MNSQTSQLVVKHRRQDRKISTTLRAPKVPVEDIKEVVWPRVDLSVVFPKALTCEEVGHFAVYDKL